jgi:hypothetical protein
MNEMEKLAKDEYHDGGRSQCAFDTTKKIFKAKDFYDYLNCDESDFDIDGSVSIDFNPDYKG